MPRHILIILFISFFYYGLGQSSNNKIYQKFVNADSVILVSHLTTYTPVVNEKKSERNYSYRLVERNRVNYKIIKEYYKLDNIEIDSIAQIIITPNSDSIIEDIKCFIPNHGIIIFKKGKCSFFDICFGCRHFVTSKDINLSDELDDETWTRLESFFRNRKLNYDLTVTDSETSQNE